MRETTKLALEAQAREERAAQEAAREANKQLAEALEAVESAAKAVQSQPQKKRYRVVAPVVGGGAVDPKTGKFYPAVTGGVVDPETGQVIKLPVPGRTTPP
jgi:hypothetical protein